MNGPKATGMMVSTHLGACGFKRSTSKRGTVTDGFHVKELHGLVSVYHTDRSDGNGQELPIATSYLQAYTDALDSRWVAHRADDSVHVTQRTDMPGYVSPPFYRDVRNAIEMAGAQLISGDPRTDRSGVAVTREPGHVRVMILPWGGEEVTHLVRFALKRASGRWEVSDAEPCAGGMIMKVKERS